MQQSPVQVLLLQTMDSSRTDLTHLLHLTMEQLQPTDVTLAIPSLAVQQGHVLESIVGVALLLFA